MAKLWYMEFVPGDWLHDPAVSMLKPTTRGIWIDLICAMHALDRCGTITGNADTLSRICRATPNETKAAISDLRSCNAADVTSGNENGTDIYTICNRRMRREHDRRKSNTDKVKDWRDKKRNHDVTNDVTGEKPTSLVLSLSSPSIPPVAPQGGRGRGRKGREEKLDAALAERKAKEAANASP